MLVEAGRATLGSRCLQCKLTFGSFDVTFSVPDEAGDAGDELICTYCLRTLVWEEECGAASVRPASVPPPGGE